MAPGGAGNGQSWDLALTRERAFQSNPHSTACMTCQYPPVYFWHTPTSPNTFCVGRHAVQYTSVVPLRHKMCLKSPCTSTSASSAVLAVQGLLRQILNSFPFLYCQILQMTLLNISPCPLPCSIALPIPLKCILSYQPLIKIQLIKPNPLRRARAECNTVDIA